MLSQAIPPQAVVDSGHHPWHLAAPAQAREQGRIAEGDLVVLSAFGAGFQWSAAALQF